MKSISRPWARPLGYPWYKDDSKNSPNATEKDGVCVGEHTPETLAAEAAGRIRKLEGVLRQVLADVQFAEKSGRWHDAMGWIKRDAGEALAPTNSPLMNDEEFTGAHLPIAVAQLHEQPALHHEK